MTTARGRRSGRLAITVHLERDVGLEIQRLAGERGVSLSASAAALLGDALQGPLERQYVALIQPVVEQTVRDTLSVQLGRVGDLAFRAALESGETRRLVASVLVSQIGVPKARDLGREAHSAAWQQLREPLAEDEPAAAVQGSLQVESVCQDRRTRS